MRPARNLAQLYASQHPAFHEARVQLTMRDSPNSTKHSLDRLQKSSSLPSSHTKSSTGVGLGSKPTNTNKPQMVRLNHEQCRARTSCSYDDGLLTRPAAEIADLEAKVGALDQARKAEVEAKAEEKPKKKSWW